MKMSKKVGLGLVSLFAAGAVMAGAGGTGTDTTFDSAVTLLNDFLQGSLGKLVATAMFLVGIVMGVMKQSIMAAVPAVATAIAVAIAPTVLDTVFTGALPL